ncbi:MAG TPA: stalk domain-containing protein [Candidatus Tumulicola sp.]
MKYVALRPRTLAGIAAVALTASALLVFGRPVEMLVDGERIESDVPPVITASDKVFVPLRTIADALGAQTSLTGKDRIEVVRGGESLRVKVGDDRATIDGLPVTLKHVPFRVRGRVMVELRAVASAFNVRVSYDARGARVDVLTPGIGQAISPVSSTRETQ